MYYFKNILLFECQPPPSKNSCIRPCYIYDYYLQIKYVFCAYLKCSSYCFIIIIHIQCPLIPVYQFFYQFITYQLTYLFRHIDVIAIFSSSCTPR